MAIQESAETSLRKTVRKYVDFNKINGDDGYNWINNGSYIASYEMSFSGVLKGSHIWEFIKDRQNPVVVDLMGPSEAISTLFMQVPNKENLGVAVSLQDSRTKEEKKRDASLNVIQLEGDIMKSSTWSEIEKKLNGRKADLIMERGLCGFDCIPTDSNLYAILLRKAWRLLSRDNGVIMAWIPNGFGIQATELADRLKDNNVNAWSGRSITHSYSVGIGKDSNSPGKLSL